MNNEKPVFAPLQNDLIIRAAFGQEVERVPVWMMRQAGRYLPEYHLVGVPSDNADKSNNSPTTSGEVRKGRPDFFTLCKTKELAAEITLQPIDRFPIDAAIVFTDILVVPQALGMEVIMVAGQGPKFPSPLKHPDELKQLKSAEEALDGLGYVMEVITLVREKLQGRVPLIGFSGAPWTLMAYMIEGGGSKLFSNSKSWIYKWPEESLSLLRLLTDTIIIYLDAQVKAGAQLLQIFDSWAGELSPEAFQKFSLPFLREIAHKIKALHPSIPLIVFAKGAHYAVEELGRDTEYDVVGLDWTISPEKARVLVDGKSALQGNLDPCALFGSPESIQQQVEHMLGSFAQDPRHLKGLIANLGHGLHPSHDPTHVGTFVDAVHSISERMIQKNKKDK